MGFRDVTRDAVMLAIQEFDELGRDAFLAKYGFRAAREYFVVRDGKRYDSKAIVGAAHGFLGPGHAPLGVYDFSGGEHTVVEVLEQLGFEVTRPDGASPPTEPPQSEPGAKRNPRWAEPELILALDLYLAEGALDDKDERVIALSELLNELPIHGATRRDSVPQSERSRAQARQLRRPRSELPGKRDVPRRSAGRRGVGSLRRGSRRAS